MGLVKKILYGAIGIGLVIALIVIIVKGFNKGESDVSRGMEQYTEISSETDDIEKSYYDGKIVSGQEVIDTINKYIGEDEFTIAVINGKGNTACYIKYSSVASDIVTFGASGTVFELSGTQSKETHANYINPDGSFKGKVYKDSNDTIIRIDFTQK